MKHHLLAMLLLASPCWAAAQAPAKAPDIVGIPLGMNQAEARARTSAMFPSRLYRFYEASAQSDQKALAFAYDRISAGHDQFGVGFSADGTINFLIHTVEYNEPPSNHPPAPSASNGSTTTTRQIEIHLPFGKKRTPKPAPTEAADPSADKETGTDLDLRPSLSNFLEALTEKYGPPAVRQDNSHWYTWYLDSHYRALRPEQVPYVCKNLPYIPIVYTNTSGPAMLPGSGPLFGHSYPTPPETAYSNCPIGIWVNLSTRDINGMEAVMSYSITLYNQGAAFLDMKARQDSIPKGPGATQKPKL